MSKVDNERNVTAFGAFPRCCYFQAAGFSTRASAPCPMSRSGRWSIIFWIWPSRLGLPSTDTLRVVTRGTRVRLRRDAGSHRRQSRGSEDGTPNQEAALGGGAADILRIHPGALSAVVRRLEERRLIVRHRDPVDRRRVLLGVTPTGRRLVLACSTSIESVFDDALRELAPGMMTAAVETLRQLDAKVRASLDTAQPRSDDFPKKKSEG